MPKRRTHTRNTDSRGRVNLSVAFANRKLIVKQRDSEWVLRVLPEREAWLYENKAALASVGRGLAQARKFIERDQSIVPRKPRRHGA